MMRCLRFCMLLVLAIPLTPQFSVPVARTQEGGVVYKSEVRVVEVHAMVKDRRGRYVDGLQPGQFEIRDNGELQPITAFEPMEAGFDCAILLDSTGSMEEAMPALKSAVQRLIDAFRGQDRFAVYRFSTTLRRIHDYSRDKAAAKQAVRNIMPGGGTALFDSLTALAADLAGQKGKKAIIAFTDGNDNASYLPSMTVMTRAKTLGLPIYAVAQGEALGDQQLFRMLREIARATGGEAYAVRKPSQMRQVFEEISNDVQHAYLLTYEAPAAGNDRWRTIQVIVKGVEAAQVRAREGYFPR